MPGDSSFNEAFAVTVEQEGLARWLRSRGREAEIDEYHRRRAVQLELVMLMRQARERLAAEYARPAVDAAARRAAKQRLLDELATELRALQQRLGPRRGAGIGTWLERGINNAHLASVATYWDCVGGFEQVLAAQGGSLPAFYAEVARLAKLPAATRHERLCRAVPASDVPPAASPAPAAPIAPPAVAPHSDETAAGPPAEAR